MPGETSEQATIASDPLRFREGKVGGGGAGGSGLSGQLGVTAFYHFGQKLFSDPLVPDDIGPFVTNVGGGGIFQRCVHCCSSCPRETSCPLHMRPAERARLFLGG